MTPTPGGQTGVAQIRLMEERDLPAADRIFREAFGTFLAFPDPSQFAAGRDFIGSRWRARRESCFAADLEGALAGTNIATRWGSFAYFGPLTISPAFWNHGVAQRLLAATVDLFDRWQVRDAGLYTFAHSVAHSHLYQKFGFWPRFLTAIAAKTLDPAQRPPSPLLFSGLNPDRRNEVLSAARHLTDTIYPGLDVTSEIEAVAAQNLGDTVLVWEGDALDAFAVCHCGEGTEAGPGNCYIKFAAVRPAPHAQRTFGHMLAACESLAAARSLQRVETGVNIARAEAYKSLLDAGYRSFTQGVAMLRPDRPAFNRPGVFVLDDWR